MTPPPVTPPPVTPIAPIAPNMPVGDDARDARGARRARQSFALAVLSLAFLVALAATHAPLADVWLTATPFALMGWLGFAAALSAAAVGAGRLRIFALALATVWIGLWLLTFSMGAQDALASVRRATFAFIAF